MKIKIDTYRQPFTHEGAFYSSQYTVINAVQICTNEQEGQ